MQASYDQIKNWVAEAARLEGDFVELGVYRGKTFIKLARSAYAKGRTCYGVDSFEGFPAPHPVHDRGSDGSYPCPTGDMNAGGQEMMETIRALTCGAKSKPVLIRGWIPDALFQIPDAARFAFAHVDVDLYVPTLAGLIWLWPRMVPGGVIACHDWFKGENRLATLAIANFCKDQNIAEPDESPIRYAVLRKG